MLFDSTTLLLSFPRFWSKVAFAPSNECWEWVAACNRHGYGIFGLNGKLVKAHRLAYEILISLIPQGFEIDHLCRNHSCVNPLHLEPVTHRENALRGESFTAQNARKTHCPQGHSYNAGNTYFHPPNNRHPNGRRRCRICHSASNRKHRTKRA